MRIEEYHQKKIDTTELFLKFREQFEHVYFYQIDGQEYFYRPLTRAEYREIGTHESTISDFEREDLLVSTCLLYPEQIDFEHSPAGLIPQLANLIIECSYLNKDDRREVLRYYESEMATLDNQITCVIHEAFPTYSLEDIDNWDIERTMKYLSRAIWTLHTLRGTPINMEKMNEIEEGVPDIKKAMDPLLYNTEKLQQQEEVQKQKQEEQIKPEEPKQEVTHRGQPKTPLTPEKIAELSKKYPGIDWAHDNGMEGIDGLVQPNVFEKPPALRPRNTVSPARIDAENIWNH